MVPRRTFGQVMRQLREKADCSQEELAARANMDRSYIGRLERNEKQPTLTTLFQIAGALGVRASLIIARMER